MIVLPIRGVPYSGSSVIVAVLNNLRVQKCTNQIKNIFENTQIKKYENAKKNWKKYVPEKCKKMQLKIEIFPWKKNPPKKLKKIAKKSEEVKVKKMQKMQLHLLPPPLGVLIGASGRREGKGHICPTGLQRQKLAGKKEGRERSPAGDAPASGKRTGGGGKVGGIGGLMWFFPGGSRALFCTKKMFL